MAARLAERGVRTLVCEEHARIGDPVHCTGVLSADSFTRFDLPSSATLNQLTSVRFLSPGGIPVDYTTPAPLATVIDRPVFDRALADRALAAGAEIRLATRVTSLEVHKSGVRAHAIPPRGPGPPPPAPSRCTRAWPSWPAAPATNSSADSDSVFRRRICTRHSASSARVGREMSSCTSVRTSPRAVLRGRCRCCVPMARARGLA